MIRTAALRAAVLAAVPLLAGCSGSDQQANPSTSPSASTGPQVVMVVVGDSIPYNLQADCPGCTGFVDKVGAQLDESTEAPVVVRNLSRHDGATTADIAEQLEEDSELIELLGAADVVLASFGFNDQPPYTSGPAACPLIDDSSTLEEAVQAAATTSKECVDAHTATLVEEARGVLHRLRSLAPKASIGVLNSYNSWTGWERLSSYPELVEPLSATVRYALELWNQALCTEAVAEDIVCIDVYHRFNGPDGSAAAGTLLAADYTHPSQEGNDAIAELVMQSGVLAGVE